MGYLHFYRYKLQYLYLDYNDNNRHSRLSACWSLLSARKSIPGSANGWYWISIILSTSNRKDLLVPQYIFLKTTKFTRPTSSYSNVSYLFQMALGIIWLPVQITLFLECNSNSWLKHVPPPFLDINMHVQPCVFSELEFVHCFTRYTRVGLVVSLRGSVQNRIWLLRVEEEE